MSDAIKKLHDYLAMSPSVVYPEDVLAYLPAIEDENAKLRELVALWSVINKHMSLCATTDCVQCPVREECGESVYLEGLLGIDSKGLSWRVQEHMAEATDVQDENAKLRELMVRMAEALGIDSEWADPNWCKSNCVLGFGCWPEEERTDIRCPAWAAMQELGIEVDDA